MFDLNNLKQDVSDWVTDFVSIYNSDLEAVPCPFAKKAIADEKIYWMVANSREGLMRNAISTQLVFEMTDGYEATIIGINPDLITVAELEAAVLTLNQNDLMLKGLVALGDHPDDVETIAGVEMNQGKWALMLIQPSEKLARASDALKKQGYYDKWTQEQLDDVVTWRTERW